jgi:hypothetical protein
MHRQNQKLRLHLIGEYKKLSKLKNNIMSIAQRA